MPAARAHTTHTDWNNERYGVKRNDTGMSDLTVRFPATEAYAGESREAGYNGLYMFHVANSWVRAGACACVYLQACDARKACG